MVLIAIGGLAGNLPGIIRDRDWSPSQINDLYSTVLRFAIFGTIFLAVAYALIRSRRWGACLTAAVSTAALIWMAIVWSRETYNQADFAVALMFWAVPLLFTLTWALADVARQLKAGAIVKTSGQGDPVR
jgi:predicted membrane-bound spermidine synthase